MSQDAEADYKELVGEEGYNKVVTVADLWELQPTSRQLFFACLNNAYWRGANKALDDCREVLRKKGQVDTLGNKSN
jgi:hypothetical protein